MLSAWIQRLTISYFWIKDWLLFRHKFWLYLLNSLQDLFLEFQDIAVYHHIVKLLHLGWHFKGTNFTLETFDFLFKLLFVFHFDWAKVVEFVETSWMVRLLIQALIWTSIWVKTRTEYRTLVFYFAGVLS